MIRGLKGGRSAPPRRRAPGGPPYLLTDICPTGYARVTRGETGETCITRRHNFTTNGADKVYKVYFTIDTSLYNGGGSYIDAVLVKIASEVDLPPSTLLAAPGATNDWTLTAGGLAAAGCKTGGDSGALCAQDGQSAPVSGGPYTWEFAYATTGSSLLLGTLASDIKAEYVDGSGNKVGALVSEGITLGACGGTTGVTCGTTPPSSVPEPTSIALFAGVVTLTAGAMRRRRGSH